MSRLPTPQASFGRRRIVRVALVAGGEAHVRRFFCETMTDMGFLAIECADGDRLQAALADYSPELVILDPAIARGDGLRIIHDLADRTFAGQILLTGQHDPATLTLLHKIGAQAGLQMMPYLCAPFQISDLDTRLEPFQPPEPPPDAEIDFDEALAAGWLELYYQPKLDPRSLRLRGAEALIRMRHPTWGLVQPARFVPPLGDPRLIALSEFVVTRAAADWTAFAAQSMPIEIAINLPLTVLQEPRFVDLIRQHLPRDPKFHGLIVEINEAEAIKDLALAQEIALALRLIDVGISIDDVTSNGFTLATLDTLPFVEFKADRSLVSGACVDPLKRAACQTLIDVAARCGVRTVAEGAETREDLALVRDLGFDMVQGFICARAMEPRRFAWTMLTHTFDVRRRG
ncbi:MAG: EAL domain-containing protein [Variibacter sp.]